MKKVLIVLVLFGLGVFFAMDLGVTPREGCAFCDQEVLDAQVFYEGKGVLGLLTHKPALEGHVLIIPRRHVERLENLSEEESLEMYDAIKKIDRAVRTTFGFSDYVLVQKNGYMAGQTVPHVHFHYLPGARFLAIRFLTSYWFKPLKKDQLKRLKDALSESLLESSAISSSQT